MGMQASMSRSYRKSDLQYVNALIDWGVQSAGGAAPDHRAHASGESQAIR